MCSTATPSTAPISMTRSSWGVSFGSDTDELVDDLAAAAFEDVDGEQVAAHRADAAGDLTERPGPIGKPEPDDQRAGTAVAVGVRDSPGGPVH